MNVALHRSWTQAQFFAWAEAQEARFEFDGFQPVAMTGGSPNHSAIHRNVLVALSNMLKGTSCQALGSDAGIATVEDAVRYPDVVVTCSPFGAGAKTVPNPVIVFEVISPASTRVDRITKVREYAAVASILCYVIVESVTIGVTVLSRAVAGDAWKATVLTEDDMLDLPEVGARVSVGEMYSGIDFEGGQ